MKADYSGVIGLASFIAPANICLRQTHVTRCSVGQTADVPLWTSSNYRLKDFLTDAAHADNLTVGTELQTGFQDVAFLSCEVKVVEPSYVPAIMS